MQRRPGELVTTILGWLMGLGIVAFAWVGFQSIQSSAPAPQAAASSPSAPSSPSRPSTGPSTPSRPSKPGASVSPTALVAEGQKIVAAQCVACHVVNGQGGAVGPDLNKVMAGQTLPGMVPGGHPTDPAWLSRWIQNPQAVWPSASMPNLGLTPSQVQAVVAYLKQLR